MHAVETMAWTGAVPWHGLGTEVTDDSALSNGKAFMAAAGLDWEVGKCSLYYGNEHPFKAGQIIPNEYHLIRLSDGSQVSTRPVTDDHYHIVQNAEMFEVFDPFLASGEMQLNTAGSLFGGQKVWVLVQLKDGFTLPDSDTVCNFFLFTISHTGVDANTAFYTPVRVVCNNTLRLAQSGARNTIRDHHRHPFDVELMRDAMELVKTQSVRFEELAVKMANRRLTGQETVEYFRSVYGAEPSEDESGKLVEHATIRRAIGLARGQDIREATAKKPTKDSTIRRQQEIIDALKRGSSIDELPGEIAEAPSVDVNPGWNKSSSQQTLWGAYNVVTFMEDHAPVRRSRSEDLQLNRALYGRVANDYKVNAITEARSLVAA